jgi:hypothetical protein
MSHSYNLSGSIHAVSSVPFEYTKAQITHYDIYKYRVTAWMHYLLLCLFNAVVPIVKVSAK